MHPLLEKIGAPDRQPLTATLHSSTGAWTALLTDPTQELTHALHRRIRFCSGLFSGRWQPGGSAGSPGRLR